VVFDDAEHFSPAALPGMRERTISVFTFSKSFAMTGLRLGYLVAKDARLRERMKKVLFYTASNVTSIVQYGGIGALEGPQDNIVHFRTELQGRRDLFYEGIEQYAGGVLSGAPPLGAFYAFLKIDPAWVPPSPQADSRSWAMAEHLITRGRIGCVPGVDFGARGEGYVRFCFARGRDELNGALHAMSDLFADKTTSTLPSRFRN
jgi:aspartate/methionine/tyrosine aminotransferase